MGICFRFIVALGVFAVCGGWFQVAQACRANEESIGRADKPNLIVIMTDEHNFRTLGCYRRRWSAGLMWGRGGRDAEHRLDRKQRRDLHQLLCDHTGLLSVARTSRLRPVSAEHAGGYQRHADGR